MSEKKIKVLLIHPPLTTEKKVESGLKYPPMGITFLAATTRKNNYKVKIFDGNVEKNSSTKLKDIIKEYQPDVVGISFTSLLAESAHIIAKQVKDIDSKITTIAGGYHPTVMPKETIKDKNFDFVCVGEGEVTFIEWLEKIENNQKDFDQIKGITYLQGDKIIETPKRSLIPEISLLPFPAYDLLPLKLYSSQASIKKPYIIFVRSRGCPFRCIFCGVQKMFGRQYRVQSSDKTISEIDELVNVFGIKEINFKDSDFLVNKGNVEKLCNKLIEKNYDLVWTCNVRVDMVNEQILILMRKAGCYLITYGVESCNQEVLNNLQKDITVEQIRNAVKYTNTAKIKCAINIILGGIGETSQSFEQTLNIINELDTDYVAFTYMTAFPGSALYDQAIELGWFLDGKPTNYSFEEVKLNATKIPNEELFKALKKAFISFYLRPKYIWKRIKLLSLAEIKNNFVGLWIIIRNVLAN